MASEHTCGKYTKRSQACYPFLLKTSSSVWRVFRRAGCFGSSSAEDYDEESVGKGESERKYTQVSCSLQAQQCSPLLMDCTMTYSVVPAQLHIL